MEHRKNSRRIKIQDIEVEQSPSIKKLLKKIEEVQKEMFMKYYINYYLDYIDVLEEFEDEESALTRINNLLKKRPGVLSIEDFTVIEGKEIQLEEYKKGTSVRFKKDEKKE